MKEKEEYSLREAIKRREHLRKVLGQEFKKIWDDYKLKFDEARKEGKVSLETSIKKEFLKKRKIFNREWGWFNKKSVEYVFYHYDEILDRWQNMSFKGDIKKVRRTMSITGIAVFTVLAFAVFNEKLRINPQAILWFFVLAFAFGFIITSFIKKKSEAEVLPSYK